MKLLEATVNADKAGHVSDAIKDIVGGFTILEGSGRGSSERQTIRAGRGTGTFIAEFNKVETIRTIVDEKDVERVTTAISDAVFTGKSGDGIITVSDVQDVFNIASKKKNSEAL